MRDYSGGEWSRVLEQPVSRAMRLENRQRPCAGIGIRPRIALQSDGWWLRSDIIWSKPNPMPESVTDRPTKAHEYVFLLSKSASYYYDAAAIAERILYEDSIRGGSGGPTGEETVK